ncbi:MAG: zinc-dependent metalloprotease, partial [Caldimonas sp.]
SPEAEAFVQGYMKDVTMHEVGHTLGLRHNFRSSRAFTAKQLADPEFTRKNGITGSVMDYAAVNLNGPTEERALYGTPFNGTLGPYDYWAIEYAYRPLPSGLTAAQETAALEKIAARSGEPLLAYGTDEDFFLGVDPESLQGDLGNDMVAFAKKRIAIAQDLLRRQETRELRPGQEYNVLLRSARYAVRDVARAANVLSRQIGGVRTVRDQPGSGRDPLAPVPYAEQRAALDVITGDLLAADSFRVSPALQRRFAIDFEERSDVLFGLGEGPLETDWSLSAQVSGMQRALLGALMSDAVATRMLESAEKAPSGASRALRMPELYERLTRAVWSELDGRSDIAPMRRELQRDHVNRVAAVLLRPGGASRADTRGVVRVQARGLLDRIRLASQRAGLGDEARAHLLDSADTLAQALSARLQRAGA